MAKRQLVAASKKVRTPTKTQRNTMKSTLDDVDQREMIAREAYLRAEKRGFNGGDPVQDWLEAEAKVSEMMKMSA